MIKLEKNDEFALAHFVAIKDEILAAIDHVLKYKGLKAGKKRKPIALSCDLEAYLYMLKTDTHLEQLIITPPELMIDKIRSVKSKIPSLAGTSDQLLYYIFVERVYNPFDKYDFIKRINLDTCVYCNRNYIYYLKKKERVKPQLDHFYPKSKYPFLGMSYYNLIPCCQTCNGPECKGNQDPLAQSAQMINPYLVINEDFRFSYDIISSDYANGVNRDAFSVSIDTSHKSHLRIFRLEELYAKHTDHVAELFLKASMNYSPKYRDYLINCYKKLGLTNHEINLMIIGNYTTDESLLKRPLAKMYRDIAEDLGLLE